MIRYLPHRLAMESRTTCKRTEGFLSLEVHVFDIPPLGYASVIRPLCNILISRAPNCGRETSANIDDPNLRMSQTRNSRLAKSELAPC